MKQVLSALIVILALASMSVGATLADFSDTETSRDNYIAVGSLDLKVNGMDDPEVDPVIEIADVAPGEEYGPFTYQVRNDGEAKLPDGSIPPAYLYIHFKQLACANVNPPNPAYACDDDNFAPPDNLKPEPEMVAEYGGQIDCTEVPGVGRLGDNCTMPSYTGITVYWDDNPIPIIESEKLADLECQEIYLGELEPWSVVHTVDIYVHVQPISEEDAVAAGILDQQYFSDTSVFRFWPTNGLMFDKVSFSIAFELFQEQLL